jgi:hypothetical protein
MRKVNSDPASGDVYISSVHYRSMHSEWHRIWWSVKISFTGEPKPNRSGRYAPSSEAQPKRRHVRTG